MSELLSVKDLTISYVTTEGKVSAVNGISFDIAKGETLGLVGETGAGKTTVALGMMRLVPDPPGVIDGGSITFGDVDLLKQPNSYMRTVRGGKISMIFQDPMTSLNPVIPVGAQIAEVIQLHQHVSKVESVLKAQNMLELVGISAGRYGDFPHQFSGGMKQRVIIAIALACNPELLIADEPTTALDVTIQAQILELMAKLKQEFSTSMLMITHDLGVVAETCDRVAIMYAGEIVEIGTLEHIFEQTAHPYTLGLFGSIPKLNEETQRLTPIAGHLPNPTALPEGCHFAPRCKRCMDVCNTQKPHATEVAPGHIVRCHLLARQEVQA